MRKAFVKVQAEFDGKGKILPLSIQWEDGRVFPVDQVLDITPAASMSVGGSGLRYTCRIGGREKFLYLDWSLNRWFVEVRP